MTERLPLRDNPLFQQSWRGGSHATWRRWFFSPGMEMVLGLTLFLLFTATRWDSAMNMGQWLMLVTALASTLVAIRQLGTSMDAEWRLGRMQDLLTSRLSGRDLLWGMLGGELARWVVWVPGAALVSLLLLLWAPGDLQMDIFPATETRDDQIAFWGYLLFYTVTQTIFASGVMALAVTNHRSATRAQIDGMSVLVIWVPLVWLIVSVVVASRAGHWIDATHALGRMLFYNWGHAGFQLAKLGIGLWCLRRASREFHERMLRLADLSAEA